MLHFARLWRRSPMKIKSPKDFWAGVMFMGFGLFFAIWAVIYYQMGTAVRMGPAYFPAVLGGMLAVLGFIVFLGSFAVEGPPVPEFSYRPLILIILGCVLYGYLLKPLGLGRAPAALVYVSALGGHEVKWEEVNIPYLILVFFS